MVERWLQQLEHQMVVSLRDVASEACAAYATSVREEWVLVWPGQIVQAGSCVQYTAEVRKRYDTKIDFKIRKFLFMFDFLTIFSYTYPTPALHFSHS